MNKITEDCINWIKQYCKDTGAERIVVGISGGKDSTVVAALCASAVGADNVYGVLMPNGQQNDINDSERVVDFLGIHNYTVNIADTIIPMKVAIEGSVKQNLSEQATINLPPRIRMATLYSIAQTLNARVAGTGNFCERMLGYTTLWGDSVADFNPIGNLLVSQVKEIGLDLRLPRDLVHKTPADGLTGKSDEEKLGFSYDDVEKVITNRDIESIDEERLEKINDRIRSQKWKSVMINVPMFKPLPNKRQTFMFGTAAFPITNSHVGIIENLIKNQGVDVVVAVTDHEYKCSKFQPKESKNLRNIRMQAAKLALFDLSTKYPGSLKFVWQMSRTYRFLKEHPEIDGIVIGEDEYKDLKAGKWEFSEELLSEKKIFVIPRTDNISSTSVREMLTNKLPYEKMKEYICRSTYDLFKEIY